MATLSERRAAQAEIAGRFVGDVSALIANAMMASAGYASVTGQAILPDDYGRKMEGLLISVWGESARQSGRLVIGEFKADFGIETKEDEESLFDQIVREFAEQYGAARITQIVETTREQIATVILDGYRNGLTLPEIMSGLRNAIPELSRIRAGIIARTEVHSASSFASQRVAKTSRRPLLKRWVAVEDHRTRDFGEGDGVIDEFSHRAIDGQTVALDQPYLVPKKNGTTEPLMFPGDPNGSAGNVINCRCAETYVRPE